VFGRRWGRDELRWWREVDGFIGERREGWTP
jgi:hypothetical protein